MVRLIESFIDSITMYRLMLYGLYLIVATAIGLSLLGQLSFSPLDLVLSLAVLMIVAYFSNRLFILLYRAPYNPESWQITALILFFLVFPQNDIAGYIALAAVAAIAMASKYVLAIRGRHIFNPVAIAVVISSLLGIISATWWVCTLFMLPVVSIVGLLVVWKLRHFLMVIVYGFVSVGLAILAAKIGSHDLGDVVKNAIFSSPLIFAATIMLTEPQTSPTTRFGQVSYAVLVGVLSGLQLGWISKPDVAIAVGNIFAFLLGARRAIRLSYVGTRQIAPTIREVILQPEHKLRFKPGQYLELTLPTAEPDDRGVRRMFSIASQPDSAYIRLAMVVPDSPSTFKRTLFGLSEGSTINATQVGGNFTLPIQIERPVMLIAGGIGVTPYLSMIEDLIARGEKRPITLFYAVRRQDLLVYTDLLKRAVDTIGLRIVAVVSEPAEGWKGETGLLTVPMMQKYIKNMYDCKIYISGPNSMVDMFRKDLHQTGVRSIDIVTDYFTGY